MKTFKLKRFLVIAFCVNILLPIVLSIFDHYRLDKPMWEVFKAAIASATFVSVLLIYAPAYLAYQESKKQPARNTPDPTSAAIIDFATWYSGMERSKVEKAYLRYLKENKPQSN